jgi:hypothetical protein
MNERLGARPWVARTQVDLGRLLASDGDGDRAVALFQQALATAEELGMEAVARRARAALAG